MKKNPAISVVVGVYNGQRYIAQAVESILSQSFEDFEFIIVDDGSTDRTLSILRGYEKKDGRLKVVACPHRGIVDAANTGLEHSQAELIARADADDISLPERLEKQFRYMREHSDVVALGTQLQFTDPYGMELFVTELPLDHEGIERQLLEGRGGTMPQPAVMMRRAQAMAVGGYRKQYEWLEDLDLFLRMAEVGRLRNLPEALVRYRVHPRSTNATRYQYMCDAMRVLLEEAYRRRQQQLPAEWAPSRPIELGAEQFRRWVWLALRTHNIGVARRHALSALKRSPFEKASWIAALCALRGH